VSYESVVFDVDGSTATITLNRPDAANGMSLALMRELADVAIRCDEDPAIRAVIITGAGRFFSAGGDMRSFSAAGDEAGALIKEMTMYFHAAISRLSRMDAPVIAAVNGIAAGAGFSLAVSCDLVVAAESAVFLSAYTAAALSPDGGSTYFVPRLVGMRRAAELMLTNRRLSASEALDWGLINEVVADDAVVERAAELAIQLASGPTVAYGEVKRMLHASLDSSLETQMEMESRSIADMTRTSDGREGIAAFNERRPPEFSGK
jgi:2-(1,2-epoxy-1,2-dihydrophenyl)acetyl-CoA isomerase